MFVICFHSLVTILFHLSAIFVYIMCYHFVSTILFHLSAIFVYIMCYHFVSMLCFVFYYITLVSLLQCYYIMSFKMHEKQLNCNYYFHIKASNVYIFHYAVNFQGVNISSHYAINFQGVNISQVFKCFSKYSINNQKINEVTPSIFCIWPAGKLSAFSFFFSFCLVLPFICLFTSG